MDDRTLLKAVVLAGEIMLVSGAEVYRVEDTMNHMLSKAGFETAETIVHATGIFVTLSNSSREPLTFVKRVPDHSTNINRIYLVNDISRRFCNDEISVEQAWKELQQAAETIQYNTLMKALGKAGGAALFSPLFGGGLLDLTGTAIVGLFLALTGWLVSRIRFNDFCATAFCAFAVAVSAILVHRWVLPSAHTDIMIISAIMPLVPGVTFTTAVRDTLNGDYTAGMARMMEAVVIALAVAAGVGCGLMLFKMTGGIRI